MNEVRGGSAAVWASIHDSRAAVAAGADGNWVVALDAASDVGGVAKWAPSSKSACWMYDSS